MLLAEPLLSLVLHRPELYQHVGLASPYVLGSALFNTGIFAAIGQHCMGLASLSQVVQPALRLAVAPLLIIAGSSVLSLILDVAVFFGVYLTLAPAFGVIGDSDMYTLRLTLGELKVVGRLASPVLRYEGLVISLTRKVRKSS